MKTAAGGAVTYAGAIVYEIRGAITRGARWAGRKVKNLFTGW